MAASKQDAETLTAFFEDMKICDLTDALGTAHQAPFK
jgi:hypothetical protein